VDRAALKRARILIVDDQPQNLSLLERLLAAAGYRDVRSTADSGQAVDLCRKVDPDLVLLDLQMPQPDGFEIMRQLEPATPGFARLPILVLTADGTRETKMRALEAGAGDFLTKPFDAAEVLLRVANLLTTRLLQLELRNQNALLEQRVRERTQKLRQRTQELEEARLEILDRLVRAAEYRDDATGEHARRVGRLAALLAERAGLPSETVDLLGRAAPLHDVGKIAVSDRILLKPGKLSPGEFEAMKAHTSVGGEILGRSRSPLLRMSEEIALTHHEWWDGSGYPSGLSGERIPISGRIVALADVYDALTNERPYREPWPPERALMEIERLSGRQFDPQLVAHLAALVPEAAVSSRSSNGRSRG
jgi:putative two-component system response regulator